MGRSVRCHEFAVEAELVIHIVRCQPATSYILLITMRRSLPMSATILYRFKMHFEDAPPLWYAGV